MNWALFVSSTDYNCQIWFILTMTKSPQYHNRDPQFQFIPFQNEWHLSKMRFLHIQFLEFGLTRKLVSYQIRKIAFLLSGKRLSILSSLYHLIGRPFLMSDWLLMKTFWSFNDREVILKHQYKFTSNVKALHPLKGNLKIIGWTQLELNFRW